MIYFWTIVLAVLVTALLSAAEMAFIAANRVRLRHLAETGDSVAARYLEAFRHPERMLSTAMMGVTIAHIAASSFATWALIPIAGGWTAFVVTITLVPVMLVFGEVIPKTAARERATALIRRLFPMLELATMVLAPVTWGARALVGAALRAVGLRSATTRQFVSREELKLLLQLEPTEADVTSTEAEMIDKIFDLGDTAVREIMVPLVDVAALPEDATPDDAIRLIQERGFSRIPVYADRELNMVGVVTAMDLLRRGAEAADLKSLMRPATYAPETKRIDELLTEMQKGRVQLAVVVDEYGRRHRLDRGHRRADRGRDPRRARPDARHRRAAARRQLSGGRPRANRGPQRRAGLEPAHRRLRNRRRSRPGHGAPPPAGGRRVPGRTPHLHRPRGRRAPHPHRAHHPAVTSVGVDLE
jgi:putative hemolysin